MNESINLVITGDSYLGGGRVLSFAEEENTNQLFGEYLPLFQEADLLVTNLESPVIDEGDPIKKTGPALRSPVDTLSVLKKAGFNLLTLANNHIMDYGEAGLKSTLDASKFYGLQVTGAGSDLNEAMTPFIYSENGLSIAVLNLAENEFGTTNGEKPGCHPLDPVQNFYSIKKAQNLVDHVIVIVHGGHEHYELPSPRMKETYRFFVDAGASAVIAHHTHCPCGHEMYNNAPICYSLGNFLFDLPGKNGNKITPWNEGMIAELDVKKTSIDVNYHSYIQCFESAGIRKMTQSEEQNFQERLDRQNLIIKDDQRLASEFEEYCNESYRTYTGFIEPHSIRLLHALRNRNLVPSLLSEKKKRLLLNLTRCEAHRDVLIKTLSV